ncbi:hypothetical protein B0H14DRAFT_2560732 [Mycena olivaceomarginata]|nr:hypothetical protein B0H14DRAFT_2560732 [Mycena olivaceomarginata]
MLGLDHQYYGRFTDCILGHALNVKANDTVAPSRPAPDRSRVLQSSQFITLKADTFLKFKTCCQFQDFFEGNDHSSSLLRAICCRQRIQRLSNLRLLSLCQGVQARRKCPCGGFTTAQLTSSATWEETGHLLRMVRTDNTSVRGYGSMIQRNGCYYCDGQDHYSKKCTVKAAHIHKGWVVVEDGQQKLSDGNYIPRARGSTATRVEEYWRKNGAVG